MFIFAAELVNDMERNLLNIQAKILILGNGGLKNTATYEEDENLHRQVKMFMV